MDESEMVGASVLILIITCIIIGLFTSGKIDYCYIETESSQYKLSGHRPWRFDSDIGRFQTGDEARIFAESLKCEVH